MTKGDGREGVMQSGSREQGALRFGKLQPPNACISEGSVNFSFVMSAGVAPVT